MIAITLLHNNFHPIVPPPFPSHTYQWNQCVRWFLPRELRFSIYVKSSKIFQCNPPKNIPASISSGTKSPSSTSKTPMSMPKCRNVNNNDLLLHHQLAYRKEIMHCYNLAAAAAARERPTKTTTTAPSPNQHHTT